MKLNLTITDTNVLKGIALLLLLLHHLFYIKSGLYDDIQVSKNLYLVNELGKFGKLCVAIFVFLSGYGLTIQAEKNKYVNCVEFYKRRFSKLYLNYWFIWLVFVPIGILFFGRTFDLVYVNHICSKFIIDLFGLSYAFGFYGYNATWWFYSCIIILYLLFPLLYKLLPKYKIALILISLALYNSNFALFQSINLYLISFSVGMIMAHGVDTHQHFGNINKLVLWIVFFFVCCMRIKMGKYAILWDALICVVGILLYKRILLKKYLSSFLEFLGKHSMNIFLFHTFIYEYYLENFIFYYQNPIFIYMKLLVTCLLISILLEAVKNKIGFYSIKL